MARSRFEIILGVVSIKTLEIWKCPSEARSRIEASPIQLLQFYPKYLNGYIEASRKGLF